MYLSQFANIGCCLRICAIFGVVRLRALGFGASALLVIAPIYDFERMLFPEYAWRTFDTRLAHALCRVHKGALFSVFQTTEM
jgi:hypothetical protein